MNTIYKEELEGLTIRIEQDDSACSPREDDNAGTMVCWHRRYTLGDEQPTISPAEWFLQKLAGEYSEAWLDVAGLWELQKTFERKHILLPLFLYDHSIISISTSTFLGRAQHAEWDSGQVGFIYISHEKAIQEWGRKNFTPQVKEKAIKYLQGEVQTYDDYLTGNVYGYMVCDGGTVLDSCWGYFPSHDQKPGQPVYQECLEEARRVAQDRIDEINQRIALVCGQEVAA